VLSFQTNQLVKQRVAWSGIHSANALAGFATNQLVGSAAVRGVHNSAAHVLAL
jgi:hypothetical protein